MAKSEGGRGKKKQDWYIICSVLDTQLMQHAPLRIYYNMCIMIAYSHQSGTAMW